MQHRAASSRRGQPAERLARSIGIGAAAPPGPQFSRPEAASAGTWLARDQAGSAGAPGRNDEGTLSMWAFFSRRLRMWLLLAIALPLTRALAHRLALAAERRDPSTRTARALHQADSAITAVSRRAARGQERRRAKR
jgi:hypothetical protein